MKNKKKLLSALEILSDQILDKKKKLTDQECNELISNLKIKDSDSCKVLLNKWQNQIYLLSKNPSTWNRFEKNMMALQVPDNQIIHLIEKITGIRPQVDKVPFPRNGWVLWILGSISFIIIVLLLITQFPFWKNLNLLKTEIEPYSMATIEPVNPQKTKVQENMVTITKIDAELRVTPTETTTPVITNTPEIVESELRKSCDGNWILCSGDKIKVEPYNFLVEENGSCEICLLENEYIVGTADQMNDLVGLNTSETPFTAFLIIGPVETTVTLYWGGGDFHEGVVTNPEKKLSSLVDWIKTTHPDDYQIRGIQELVITATP